MSLCNRAGYYAAHRPGMPGTDTTKPRLDGALKGQWRRQALWPEVSGNPTLGRGGGETGSQFWANTIALSTSHPPIPDGRHYSVCVGVAEGVGLQELVTPLAVAIGPNGESPHTAQRATRVMPSRIRNPGALVGGKGNYTGTPGRQPEQRRGSAQQGRLNQCSRPRTCLPSAWRGQEPAGSTDSGKQGGPS